MIIESCLGPYRCPFEEWTPRHGRVFEGLYAVDTETLLIDDENPQIVPPLVVATACDARRGFFLSRGAIAPFFEAHGGLALVVHNASFDLKVLQQVLGARLDLYALVEAGRVWDTLVLRRLLTLATEGHTARGDSSLEACVRDHLGLDLSKQIRDECGDDVRTGFGRFLGRPLHEIPEAYLVYAARDTLATWHLFQVLYARIKEVLNRSRGVWGFVNDDWLRGAIGRFGPLTHHVQLKASILMDALRSNGIAIDAARWQEKLGQVRAVRDGCRERLRRRGFLAGEPGNGKALQSILAHFQREHAGAELKRTPSGDRFSTAEEDLAGLAGEDEFFGDYISYRAAEKLEATYLKKMGRPRIHPGFGYLMETGRTCCGGGFNLQNLPRESDESEAARTIRGCFVAGEGNVLIDSDYSQIELVVLAHALEHQFRYPAHLAGVINGGQDVHRLIAASVLGKPVADVTKDERASVKPISFGRPGGMGPDRLRQMAKAGYGIELTREEVEDRIRAYQRLCPELRGFLEDERAEPGLVVASALDLTPASYGEATGMFHDPGNPTSRSPQAWLGGMLLKVLREEAPRTKGSTGRPYTDQELDYYWSRARHLPVALDPSLRSKLEGRQADFRLSKAVRDWAGRRPVFTITGRLRANATFCSSRNNIFQGPAADGAILGLWLVWRAGHKIVNFVHDQVVVEAPLDERVGERVAEIEELMRRGMGEVVPGMNVKVETVVTGSLNKGDRIEDDRIGRETPLAMSRATMRSGPSHSRIETMAAA